MPRFIKGSQPSLSVIYTKDADRGRALGEVARKHWVQTFSDSKSSLGNPEQQTNRGSLDSELRESQRPGWAPKCCVVSRDASSTRGQGMSQHCQDDIPVADTRWSLMASVSTQLYCSRLRHWCASEGFVCVCVCLLVYFIYLKKSLCIMTA